MAMSLESLFIHLPLLGFLMLFEFRDAFRGCLFTTDNQCKHLSAERTNAEVMCAAHDQICPKWLDPTYYGYHPLTPNTCR